MSKLYYFLFRVLWLQGADMNSGYVKKLNIKKYNFDSQN